MVTTIQASKYFSRIIFIALLIGLYFTSWVNYLLFHTLAELFSIVVAMSIFIIAWHSRNFIHNSYLLFIGIAYLFIGLLDLLHTLSYKGMPIFTDYDYYANQLWIGARYLESLTLVGAFYYFNERRKINVYSLFSIYLLITAALIISIFVAKIFPVCFIESSGLTPFKKISEYVICVILILSMALIRRNRLYFEPRIYQLLLCSIIFTIFSELAFTFYISNYGISNLVGHYFKIVSFYLIHICIVQTGVEQPYQLIFTDLSRTNQQLNHEIVMKEQIQRQNEKLIDELQTALSEIKTLQGIIPICSSCRKIRDDQGDWNELERYVEQHASVTFSHGLCRTCAEKLYGEYAWYNNVKE